METGPLGVWLWNALTARQVPLGCLEARHAGGVLEMMQARRDILACIAALAREIRSIATRHATVRLLMTVPGVGPITAMAVVAASTMPPGSDDLPAWGPIPV